jgi:murein DD-endopeptidase MepM/ murein hydrolase activator NlpD
MGRGTAVLAAIAMLVGVGGCSSNFSRFDYPAFNLTGSTEADPAQTAAIPVPEERVYAGSPSAYAKADVSRSSLPPPAPSYTPRVKAAAYSAGPEAKPQQAAHRGSAPRVQPAVMRPPAQVAAAGPTVKVGKGDTLSILAQRYGVTVEAIQRANNLDGTRLSIGQQLIIPGAGHTPPPLASPKPVVAAQSGTERTYKVEKGDTPHLIAEKFNVDEKALMARNNVRADRLQIGQTLIIPSRRAPAPVQAAERKAQPAKSGKPNVRVVRTTPIPVPGSKAAPAEESPEVIGEGQPPQDASGRLASNDRLPSPEPMSGNSFRWPVQGRIISPFGTRPDGRHNDGINFAVPQGTSVKAAENGVVAYAGSELKAYGKLVLIRHANNWVSAYAHNGAVLVKRGDKVRRGQIIAKAGMTGSVSKPQVHFELRKGSRPVDPAKYTGHASANAN